MRTSSTVSIRDVQVGKRMRAVGDIAELVASIAAIGLLQPIVVTKEHRLVAGRHRLLACKKLGWTEIPAVVVTLDDMDRRADSRDRREPRAW